MKSQSTDFFKGGVYQIICLKNNRVMVKHVVFYAVVNNMLKN